MKKIVAISLILIMVLASAVSVSAGYVPQEKAGL